jgi:hypothetical protein
MTEFRVAFSPLTVEPRYLREVGDAVVAAQLAFAMAAWAAQVQFMQALGQAMLATHWSLIEGLHRAASRPPAD